jgi:hypothetical protein
MKSLIEYYYNIYISEIRFIDGKYHFIHNDTEYIFERINEDEVEAKLDFIQYIQSKNKYFHTIIRNKKNETLTFDGENHNVLLKVNLKNNRIINLNDILQCTRSITEEFSTNKWKKLWEEKIDNFEYYINYIQDKREEDNEFYDYFIGLGEAAISYIELLDERKINNMDHQVITHNRINTKYTLYDLYNPFNIVVDHYTRDIAEYLKSSFFNKEKMNIENIIKNLNLSEYASILLISRLLFPTFFFDIYELNSKEKVIKRKELINQMNRYESFVYNIILEIKKRTNVPTVKWLQH